MRINGPLTLPRALVDRSGGLSFLQRLYNRPNSALERSILLGRAPVKHVRNTSQTLPARGARHRQRAASGGSSVFLVRRIARVIPLYWATTALAIPIMSLAVTPQALLASALRRHDRAVRTCPVQVRSAAAWGHSGGPRNRRPCSELGCYEHTAAPNA
jgi:hypothetical protein